MFNRIVLISLLFSFMRNLYGKDGGEWRVVLTGSCVAKPVCVTEYVATPNGVKLLNNGVIVLTDNRLVTFLTEKGKIRWQKRLPRSTIEGDKKAAAITVLCPQLVAVSFGNVFSIINTDGQMLVCVSLSHEVKEIRYCHDANSEASVLIAMGEERASVIGIRGEIKAVYKSPLKDEGVREEGEETSYKVVTNGGYLLQFDKSWLVSSTFSGTSSTASSYTEHKHDAHKTVPHSPAEYKSTYDGLSAQDKEAIVTLKRYVTELSTATRSKTHSFETDPIATCAVFDAAARAQVAEVSFLFSRAIMQEKNTTLLTALFEAAAVQAFDGGGASNINAARLEYQAGDLMEAITKRARRMSSSDEAALIAACDAIESICRFMGDGVTMYNGISALKELSDERYGTKVNDRARSAMTALGK